MRGSYPKKQSQLMTINGSSERSVPTQSQSSSSNSKRVAELRFIACDTQSTEERNYLREAFQFAADRKVDVRWVEERDIVALLGENEPPPNIIYVLHPFAGPVFSQFREKAYKIYSPLCIRSCVTLGITLPEIKGDVPRPIASIGLVNAEVCCSNLSASERDAVHDKVLSMGGKITKGLTVSATHLVTPTVGSAKYYAAAKAGDMKIVLPHWVDAVLREANDGRDYSGDLALAQRYRVPVFSGYTISISQFSSVDARKMLEKQIQSNGGDYQKVMLKEKTTHLVCDEAAGEKYRAAKKWGIPVVTSSWVTDSIQTGYCMKIEPYLLKDETLPARPATPDHIKQGPNGDRATSTPHKGAKKLDRTLNISAIHKVPPVMPPTENAPKAAQVRFGPDDMAPIPEEVYQQVWEPDYVKEQGGTEHLPSVAAQQCQVDPEVIAMPVTIPPVKREAVEPTISKKTVTTNDEADAGAPKKYAMVEALASGPTALQKNPAAAQPSLAERILALKSTDMRGAALPEVSEEPTSSHAGINVLKLDQRAKPSRRLRKSTRVSPKQQRALLCWSQAPRNPFNEMLGTGDYGEGNDDEEEVVRSEPVPPPSRTRIPVAQVVAAKKKELEEGRAALPALPSVMTVETTKQGKMTTASSVAEKGSVKRNASIVQLSDDGEEGSAKKTAEPAVVAQKAEEAKRLPVFMLSNVAIEAEKKKLSSYIKALGATLLESVQYTPEVTHLVVKLPVRNEKFLACCATGKWILHPKFLEDSAAAGHLLPEVMYEWGNFEQAATIMGSVGLSDSDAKLARSVNRWRLRILETGKPAFFGWKVVLAADPRRSEGYVRLLEAGGAKVLTSRSPFLPFKNEATHFLHELAKVAVTDSDLAIFVAAGVECQKADYLSHFLCDEAYMPPLPSASGVTSRSVKRSRR